MTISDTLLEPSWEPFARMRVLELLRIGGKLMAMNGYRQHAAECLSIADDITISPKNRLVLLAMAQAWLKLAQRAEANPDADIVQQPASPSSSVLTP